MDFVDFQITNNDVGRRFDTLLRKFLPQMPLSLIYKNIRTGFIRVNMKKSKQEIKLNLCDVINIEKRLFESFFVEEKDKIDYYNISYIESIVNFKNENILVLNKPYNINVQDSKNDKKSLDSMVKSTYEKDSLTFLPGPMHRLDKLTTGLLCFSQNLSCARWFSEQISNHSIKKTYFAILEGRLNEKKEWIDFLEKDEKSDVHISKLSTEVNGKKSISIVEPIDYGKYKNIDITFAKIFIQTGRNHQIRLQCSEHGYPLLQDSYYGSKIAKFKNDFEQKLYLHCFRLEFPNNDFNIPQVLESKLPTNFINALKKCLIKVSFQEYNM